MPHCTICRPPRSHFIGGIVYEPLFCGWAYIRGKGWLAVASGNTHQECKQQLLERGIGLGGEVHLYGMGEPTWTPCLHCNGIGVIQREYCGYCDGKGYSGLMLTPKMGR